MKSCYAKIFKYALALSLMTSLTSCAGNRSVFHTFSYGFLGENSDVQLLDYSYGGRGFPTGPDRYAGGLEIIQSGAVTGDFQIADYLSVTWRRKADGKIFNDRVDLSRIRESDLKGQELHFYIKENQLHVVIITFQQRAAEDSGCPIAGATRMKCIQLYPDQKK